MISIGKAVVSEDVADKFFVCDLSKCKGACCVEGDMGAPLEKKEAKILKKIYAKVKPYLSADGIRVIEEHGTHAESEDGDLVTPTIGNNRECAYAIYDAGVLKCGIEKAHAEGKIDFQKPISCHLYPIRITRYDDFEAVNYERWNICNPACRNGRDLGVPLYRFLKGPLIRKYGDTWYKELCVEIEKKK